MIRATAFASLLILATPAWAQQQVDGGAPAPTPGLAASPAPAAPNLASPMDMEQWKKDILDQARKETDERMERAKDEMRNEVRAELATQSANRSWDEEWQEPKKKLELFEIDGYLRLRPTLLNNPDLSAGPDATGVWYYPRPIDDLNNCVGNNPCKGRTVAWADMRAHLMPTLNLGEDVRIKATIDALPNLILGSTPELDTTFPSEVLSMNQLTPSNSILIRRIYGEVNTPVGLLRFGRMGSQWGLGVLENDGDCLDCDYGTTVDRVEFVAKFANHYIVPMVQYIGIGNAITPPATGTAAVPGVTPSGSLAGQGLGQQVDQDQNGAVSGPFSGPVLGIAVARRDTDKEVQRKLDAGDFVLNYGAYFTYRQQEYEYEAADVAVANPAVNRNAQIYIPDLWFKFMNKRLRLEAEVAGEFGTIADRALAYSETTNPLLDQSLTVTQVGAVIQSTLKFLDGALEINLELGFASGSNTPGLGSRDILGNTPTVSGQIDGPGFNCNTLDCSNSGVNSFLFNRDYRIDNLLWRELLGPFADAMYVKPGGRYHIVEGFDAYLNVVYSRTLFPQNAPGDNANLGVELDPGVSYTSDDGFVASLDYGLLIPLPGLNIPANSFNGELEGGHAASLAHALRAMIAIKF